jgi:hypothetical protein
MLAKNKCLFIKTILTDVKKNKKYFVFWAVIFMPASGMFAKG